MRNGISFALCSDGRLLYSNAGAVFGRHPDCKTERLVKDGLITKVLALC